ncbi:chromatin binding protein [Malassezia cuniculi]|uniref:Chromatin binding protein n=1 Tax=Malassezia cuniculi TaxID=948313 RepID=A0AAF0EU74_9BASI|nr:chromatin binding protein [Malassezia cuniculi]
MDGFVSIWDIETRALLRWFGGHVKAVTSVSWSPHGRYLASASLDWNVNVWDLANGSGRRARTLRFDCPLASVSFSPTSSRQLLVTTATKQAYLVTFPTTGSAEPVVTLLPADDVSAACFSRDGSCIVAGTTRGALAVFNTDGASINQPMPVGPAAIRQLAFDRTGRHLVVNMNDRTIRTLTASGSPPSFAARHKFQDLVGRTPWDGVSFSSDSEYVLGGAAHSTAHKMYVWDRDSGVLVKILEGPREPLATACWHPARRVIASACTSGDIYLWKTPSTEIWSAYAPGFEELEENVEYEEREDEFDLADIDARRAADTSEAPVDIFSTGPGQRAVVSAANRARLPSSLSPGAERLDEDDTDTAFFIPPILDDAIES